MSTYIYARVSTFDQYVNGYSVDQQVRVCLEYCTRNGLILGPHTNCDLPGVFVDGGKSAYTKKLVQRPGGEAMMNVLTAGDNVVALATHRLFRRLGDMVQTMELWVEQGVSVRFTDYPMLNTDTANGKAMLYIMAVMAQLKSELISSRVKESRGYAKATAEPKQQKVHQPVIETGTKDIGAVMNAISRGREEKAFQLKGTVRAYVRCSKKDQTVEHQKQQILKSLPDGVTADHVRWYEDEGVSAFKTKFVKRKGGSRLMADLQPGDLVLAVRPDRMFRSLLDTHRMLTIIVGKGAAVRMVEGDLRTDTSQGRIMFQMLGMFAEIESQDISRMTKLGAFGAIAKNPAARKMRMPTFLRDMSDHHLQKHFQFNAFLTREERFAMHVELHLTKKNYCDTRTACRVISNKYLRRKGLPAVQGEYGEGIGTYLAKIKKLQREEYSDRRQRLLDALKDVPRTMTVRYPINVTSLVRTDRNQDEFLRIARTMPGRLQDKKSLTVMASGCVEKEGIVKLFEDLKT